MNKKYTLELCETEVEILYELLSSHTPHIVGVEFKLKNYYDQIQKERSEKYRE